MKIKYLSFLYLMILYMQAAYASSILDDASIDAASFCKYFSEKSNAKITKLLFPDAIARLDNNHYDNNSQKNLIIGLSKDLSDLKKARQVRKLVQEECLYYQLDQEGQLQIKYSLPALKYAALKFKLNEIQMAKNKLNDILLFINKRVDSHNETLMTYTNIKTALMKLENDKNEIEIELATQRIPTIKHTNLKVLLKNLAIASENRQKTLAQVEKQENWSVQVEGGAQRDFANNYNKTMQPYVALSLRYNLGAMLSDSQMNQSLVDHAVWQEHQLTGTQQQLYNTIIAINRYKTANEEHLAQLESHYAYYAKLSNKLDVSGSTKAIRFKQEVEVNKIMLSVELNYTRHMLALLDDLV